MTTADNELSGIDYIRNQAEREFEVHLAAQITTNVAVRLRRIATAGYFTADELLGSGAILTRGALLDGFLPQGSMPTSRSIFDTTKRRAPLLTALAQIPVTPFDPAGGRVFRDDGRNPWNILPHGHRHRRVAASRREHGHLGLGAHLSPDQQRPWRAHHLHRLAERGFRRVERGLAVRHDGAGPAVRYSVQELTAPILGGPNIVGAESDSTRLLLDAPLLGDATIIAISGGPMNEFTFLTSISPAWIVGFRRLSVPGDLAWRAGFEQEWRDVGDAPAIRQMLEGAGEFTFPE